MPAQEASTQTKIAQLVQGFRSIATANPKEQPFWDTTPVLKPAFIKAARKWIVAKDATYASLIEGAYVRVGNKIAVHSSAHAVALANRSLPKGTVVHPAMPPSDDEEEETFHEASELAADSVAGPRAERAPGDAAGPTSADSRAAGDRTPSSVAMRLLRNAIPEYLKDSHVLGSTHIRDKDREMARDLASCITAGSIAQPP